MARQILWLLVPTYNHGNPISMIKISTLSLGPSLEKELYLLVNFTNPLHCGYGYVE